MPGPRPNRLKNVVRKLHRWLGLALAAWLLFQATTGLALVYRHDLQALGAATPASTPDDIAAFDIQSAIDEITATWDDHSLYRIYFPIVDGEPLIALLHPTSPSGARQLLEIDPATGTIREASLAIRALDTLFYLHYELGQGESGRYLVGLLGLGLLMAALSGLWTWWPGLRRLRAAFRLSLRGTGDRQLYDWHRLAGSVAHPLILVTAFTGFMLAYGPVIVSGFGVEGARTMSPERSATSAMPPSDNWLRRAGAAIDNGGVRDLRFEPGTNRPTAVVLFNDSPGRSGPFERVRLEPGSNAVQSVTASRDLTGFNRLLGWMYSIHTRLALGRAGQLLLTIGACSLLILVVSGPWFWWRKRGRRRAQIRRAAMPRESNA